VQAAFIHYADLPVSHRQVHANDMLHFAVSLRRHISLCSVTSVDLFSFHDTLIGVICTRPALHLDGQATVGSRWRLRDGNT